QVHDSEGWAEVPVGLRLKVKLRRIRNAPDFDVLFVGGPDRDIRVSHVWNHGGELKDLFFDASQRFLFLLDLLRYNLHFIAFFADIGLLPDQLGNLFGSAVPQLPQGFDLMDDTFPLRVEALEYLDVERKAFVGQSFT